MAGHLFGAKPLPEPVWTSYQLEPQEHISIKENALKMPFGKWQPFSSSLNVLNWQPHLLGTNELTGLLRSAAHFTNNFTIVIHIRWKNSFSVSPLWGMISLQNFAHATTAQLSCHVQNFIVITSTHFGWENEISIEKSFLKWAPVLTLWSQSPRPPGPRVVVSTPGCRSSATARSPWISSRFPLDVAAQCRDIWPDKKMEILQQSLLAFKLSRCSIVGCGCLLFYESIKCNIFCYYYWDCNLA